MTDPGAPPLNPTLQKLEAVLRGIEERHSELSKLNKIIGHLASCGFCGVDDPRVCAEGGALYREWNEGKIGTGDGVRAEQARTVERMVEAAIRATSDDVSLPDVWAAALRAGEEHQ